MPKSVFNLKSSNTSLLFTPFRTHLLCFALIFPVTSFAEPDWSFCSVPVVTRQIDTTVEPLITEILADQLYSENNNFLKFNGNVRVTRGEQKLSAEQVQLDRISSLLSANGHLSFSDQLFSLKAENIELDNKNNTGIFDLAEFQMYENHLRGSAKKIVQFDTEQRELYDVSYTTCDPQQNNWSLNASKLRLNQQEGRGTALHAVLRIKDIPVFYFPWFQFPIDNRRMSGILAPTISQTNIAGTQLALPFYWNQAENFDMTLTPYWYSNRGTQLNTENRYLFEKNEGQLNLSGLKDKLIDDNRWYRRWTHETNFNDNYHASILIQRVSDSEFMEDFDHLDTITPVDYLKSSVEFSGLIADWSSQLLFEQHQIVNDEKTITSSPYKRLPRLTVDRIMTPFDNGLSIDWKNEWVRFDKEEGITGNRLHIAPSISYPIEESYYFLKPALQLDYTRYALDNNTDDLNSLQRSMPLFSLDSGLIFERQASISKNWTQTLEPRLYFLYVPYEDQSDIPDFDSSLQAENYNNLFINNRFSGVDRIGDTRQITLGITTRLLDANNKEFFSASIGQAYYADEREVSLNATIDTREKSSLMSVVNFKPQAEWDIQLANVYDQQEKESVQTDISIRKQSVEKVFNAEYHLRDDKLEQTTFSVVYPVSVNWTVFAKLQHSLIHDKPVQDLFGVAYESCCWGFKMLYEESSDKDFEEIDRAVYFQLTFKGLSSAGKDINSLLEDGILGYQPVF
jgi:LPS-assembly protein